MEVVMAVLDMTRVRVGTNNDVGAWYINAVTIADVGESDIYLLPVRPVMDIGIVLSGAGTGTIQFSMGSPAELAAGTASFIIWDGISKISHAVTAWKIVSTGGVVTGQVVIKTTQA